MRVLAFAILLGLLTVPVDAQTIWSRPYQANQIAVEAIIPDAPDDASVWSGASFITATASLSDNIELATELPVARYGAASGATSTTAVGNPYVGLGLTSTKIPLLAQLGVRIPAAPSNTAADIGRTADMGRLPAFGPGELIFSGFLNGRVEVGRFSTLRLRAGLNYSAERSVGSGRPWRLQYDAQLWREGDQLLTGLTLTGRTLLTSPGTTQFDGAVSVMANWNRVQPGLVAGTSLKDLFQQGTFAPFAGLTLSISYAR